MILYYKCGSGELDVQDMLNWVVIVDFLPLAFDRWFGWLSNLRMIFPCQMWNLTFSCLPIYTFFLFNCLDMLICWFPVSWAVSYLVWKTNLCHLLKYMIQNLCVIWPFWKYIPALSMGYFLVKVSLLEKLSRN